MKTDWSALEQFRKRDGSVYSSDPGDHFGVFRIPCGSDSMVCVVSDGNEDIPWEHVSLRIDAWKGQRVPTWAEMCIAKNHFWNEEECVVQYHPPKSEYVNNHPFVLHLWKPLKDTMPMPPSICVGIKP